MRRAGGGRGVSTWGGGGRASWLGRAGQGCAALGSLRGEKGGPGAGGAGVPLRGRAAAGSAGRGAKGARGAASLWRTAERGWVGGAKGRPASRRSPVGAPAPLLLRVGGSAGARGWRWGSGSPVRAVRRGRLRRGPAWPRQFGSRPGPVAFSWLTTPAWTVLSSCSAAEASPGLCFGNLSSQCDGP